MGFLSSLAAAGATIYAANKSASTSKKLMQQQLNWERERAQNAHQWEVQDLNAAGLNPILSAGGSGATTSGISPVMPDLSGYNSAGQAIQKHIDQKIEKQNADANTRNAGTNAIIGESQSAKNYADAAEAAERTKYIGGISTSQTAKNFAEASEKQSQIAVNKANIGLIESQQDLTSAKTFSEIWERKKKEAETKNALASAKYLTKKYKYIGNIKSAKILGGGFERY